MKGLYRNYTGLYWDYIAFRGFSPIIDNQKEKTMENKIVTGVV